MSLDGLENSILSKVQCNTFLIVLDLMMEGMEFPSCEEIVSSILLFGRVSGVIWCPSVMFNSKVSCMNLITTLWEALFCADDDPESKGFVAFTSGKLCLYNFHIP